MGLWFIKKKKWDDSLFIKHKGGQDIYLLKYLFDFCLWIDYVKLTLINYECLTCRERSLYTWVRCVKSWPHVH